LKGAIKFHQGTSTLGMQGPPGDLLPIACSLYTKATKISAIYDANYHMYYLFVEEKIVFGWVQNHDKQTSAKDTLLMGSNINCTLFVQNL